jgi:hypothetical protein
MKMSDYYFCFVCKYKIEDNDIRNENMKVRWKDGNRMKLGKSMYRSCFKTNCWWTQDIHLIVILINMLKIAKII